MKWGPIRSLSANALRTRVRDRQSIGCGLGSRVRCIFQFAIAPRSKCLSLCVQYADLASFEHCANRLAAAVLVRKEIGDDGKRKIATNKLIKNFKLRCHGHTSVCLTGAKTSTIIDDFSWAMNVHCSQDFGNGLSGARRPLPLSPSKVNLLGKRQGVIDLHTEVANGAFELGVSQKELNRAQVAGLPVDHRHLGSP